MVKIFPSIDLDSIVDNENDLGYTSVSTALYKAANEASARDGDIDNKILTLLYEACHIRLHVEKPHNPFEAGFSDSEIRFFTLIVKCINNPFVKARLSDLVWNSPIHRTIDFALLAIDSYSNIPLTPNTWFGGGMICWQRAISLCLLVGKGAGDRLTKIENGMFNALQYTTVESHFFGHSLADVLQEINLIHDRQVVVAKKLASMASEFDALENFSASGRHYNASYEWFMKAKLEERAFDMKAAEAKAFEKEAMSRLDSNDPSHLVAVGFLKNAVQTYLCIPKIFRDRHDVDQQVKDLTLRIGEFGKLSLDEMTTYRSPEIDMTESAERARTYVSGKPIFEALALFTNLHNTNYSNLREEALKNLSGGFIHKHFPNVLIGHDGRVVGATPGLSGSEPSAEDEETIHVEMNQLLFGPTVFLAVYGAILPALNTLNLEHSFTEPDLSDLARRSPLVPIGRENLWGKALFQGFNHDFATSIHILVPQIEHLVRFHLKANDVITTFIDHRAGGRETENSLTTLMKLPETEDIFGKNMTYEIGSLFCEYSGPNLRNDVAHGLLDDHQVYSIHSAYAWWFGLRLVIRSLLPPPNKH